MLVLLRVGKNRGTGKRYRIVRISQSGLETWQVVEY